MSTDRTSENAVRYVVVVHGIGKQRENETLLAVVNRFAEARRDSESRGNNVLTLGMASGQVGHLRRKDELTGGFLEFTGIPSTPVDPTSLGPFLGEMEHTGNNLRFVDLYWADLLEDCYQHGGQKLENWTEGLIGRLQLKDDAAVRAGTQRDPAWLLPTLHRLEETAVLLRRAMALRFKDFEDLIFDKFLGDVQVYGEYAHCRGRAVHRFHEIMTKIHSEHAERIKKGTEQREARYTILAHSLGSVMAFDALIYAHANQNVREGKSVQGIHNLPFPGYSKGGTPNVDWLPHVDGFVTIGSPIDKYLSLWWLNYAFLNEDPGKWLQQPDPPDESRLIPHWNFAEEQDPVGHELDTARSTKVYSAVFESAQDCVYHRCPVPGAAHVAYWKDLPLFRWILDQAVDKTTQPSPPAVPNKKPVEPPEWFVEGAYLKTLLISYVLLPLIVIVADAVSFFSAWSAEGWRTSAVSAAVFVVVCWFGRRLIMLTVWWRQILRTKRFGCSPKSDFPARRRLGRSFLVGLPITALLLLVAAALSVGVHYSQVDLFASLPVQAVSFFGAGLLTLGILVWQRWAQEQKRRGPWWAVDLLTWGAGGLAIVAGYWAKGLPWVGRLGERILDQKLPWDLGEFKSIGDIQNLTFYLAGFTLIAAVVTTFTAIQVFYSKAVVIGRFRGQGTISPPDPQKDDHLQHGLREEQSRHGKGRVASAS